MLRPVASLLASTRPMRRRMMRQLHLQSVCAPASCTLSVGGATTDLPTRQLSAGKGANGESTSGSDIVDSAAATMQWKRGHYQRIEDKFSPLHPRDEEDENDASRASDATEANETWTTPEPLHIDSYDDVQPMWKEMESRVTRRRSLTLRERGGVSGRRNVRRSDEDVWLEAGVYDDDSDEAKKE